MQNRRQKNPTLKHSIWLNTRLSVFLFIYLFIYIKYIVQITSHFIHKYKYVEELIHLMLNETVDSFQHAEILLGQ